MLFEGFKVLLFFFCSRTRRMKEIKKIVFIAFGHIISLNSVVCSTY